MPTTLKLQSFTENNILERTSLKASVAAGVTVASVESTQGLVVGQTLYVGALSREQCERVVIQTVTGATGLTFATPLAYPHSQFDAVTAILGDLIRIYRAVDINGTVPATELFSVLATRNIDPDQVSSYYTDSSGSSAYWYRSTYFNATSGLETPIGDSQPVRGDDFGHYATLTAIRAEAGFTGAQNLDDVDVDQQRRAAEAEINTRLGSHYTVPFVKPIPPIITTITEKLAAGFLLQMQYGDQTTAGKDRIKDARAMLESVVDGDGSIDDGTGVNAAGSGVSGYPDDSDLTPRMFSVTDSF